MPYPELCTIGVYGLSEEDFFQKLVTNGIDTFVDIRQRRAVRGTEYGFVNSKRLQDKLTELNIRYLHELGLAPTDAIRNLQKQADAALGVAYRKREALNFVFKKAYLEQVLDDFDLKKFMNDLAAAKAKKVVLFCVEALASACHRSLAAERVKQLFPDIIVTHL